MTSFDLNGRRAIVTGASQGIGAAIAMELARCGAHVALTARNGAKLDAVAAGIQANGPTRAISVPCDLREPGAPKQIVEAAASAFGGIDILVNNAGATKRGERRAFGDNNLR